MATLAREVHNLGAHNPLGGELKNFEIFGRPPKKSPKELGWSREFATESCLTPPLVLGNPHFWVGQILWGQSPPK